MAIVVEEEKSGTSSVSVLLWLILLGCIAAGAYYVFFKRVDIIDLAQPASFQNTQQISSISLHPELVVSKIPKPSFNPTILPAKTGGKTNPFLGF